MLIELLMAMSLGFLLFGFSLQLYLGVSRFYQLHTALIHIQNSGMFASDILYQAIKKAGYIGCLQLTENYPSLSYSSYSLTAKNKLIGIGKSDMIVRYAMLPAATLAKSMHNQSMIQTHFNVRFNPGDILIISDCKHAELWEAEKISTHEGQQKITSTQPLRFHYDEGAEVSRLMIEHFFVRKTNYRNQDGTPVYALFREDMIKKMSVELVDHVQSMQFLLTVQQGGQWVEIPAEKVQEGSQIKAVAIQFQFDYPPIQKSWREDVAI